MEVALLDWIGRYSIIYWKSTFGQAIVVILRAARWLERKAYRRLNEVRGETRDNYALCRLAVWSTNV